MQKLKRCFGWMVCGSLAAVLLAGCGKSSSDPVLVEVASPAPVIEAPKLGEEGETISLVPPPGRILLIDVWASWSAPSRAGVEVVETVRAALSGKGLDVVGLRVDEATTEVAPEEPGMGYPCGVADDALLERWGGVRALPTRLIIGADGAVLDRIEGWVPAEELQARVAAQLVP